MFNLDQSIAQWRQQMRMAGLKTRRLDELEGHLRDDVEEQVRSGIDMRQALEAAVQRIGQATMLKAEFEKTDGKKEGWQLMTIKLTGGSGLVCIIVGSLRYWTILKVAIAFAGVVPGASDFYAYANRSLAQSLLMVCFGVALLLASGIFYIISRRGESTTLLVR